MKRARIPCKRTPPVGDLVLLACLRSNYCSPLHIVFAQLKPDITLFSNSLIKVIFIELTCPSEEFSHSTKIMNHIVLRTIR